jgi:plastocyanin
MKALAVLALGAVTLVGGAPSREQVVAREFSFQLSRAQLRPGPVTIELDNFGQDAHDLRVQRVGARHVAGTPVVQAGGRAELTLTLRPGRYRFWCSLADHRARGMSATLVVR